MPLKVQRRLNELKSLANNDRVRRRNKCSLSKRFWKEIFIDRFANTIIDESGTEDEIRTRASGLGFEPVGDAPSNETVHGLENEEAMVLRGIWHRVAGHGNEPLASTFVKNIHARVCGSRADRQCASTGLALESLDDVSDNGLAAVVEGFAGSEAFHKGIISGRAGRNHLVACRYCELNSVATHTRRASPYQQRFPRRLWRNSRKLEVQLVFLEQAARSCRRAEGNDGSALIRHGTGYLRCHLLLKNRVFLEACLSYAVVLFVNPNGMANDTITDAESLDRGTDFKNLAGYIGAQDVGVFDPGGGKGTGHHENPIDRVDGYGAILYDNLILAGGGIGSRLDFDRGFLGCD